MTFEDALKYEICNSYILWMFPFDWVAKVFIKRATRKYNNYVRRKIPD